MILYCSYCRKVCRTRESRSEPTQGYRPYCTAETTVGEAQERHQLLGGILHRGALGESVRWQKYLVRGKDLLENRSGFLLTRQQQTVRCNEFIQVLVSESFGILENEASEHAMSWEHLVLPDIFSPSACAPHPQLDSQIQISREMTCRHRGCTQGKNKVSETPETLIA